VAEPEEENIMSHPAAEPGERELMECPGDLSVLGREPVGGDRPEGGDVRDDPVFEELQAEVDKLSAPAAAGPVDWDKVSRLASGILLNKSKDLLVASYLAVALIHTRRPDGFGAGLKLYLELIECFWEGLYPPKTRLQGRVRSLEWWLEKTESALRQEKDLTLAAAQLAQIAVLLNRLDDFLREHLENAPSLAPLKEYVRSLTTKAAQTAATEAPVRVLPERAGAALVAGRQQTEPQNGAVTQQMTVAQEADQALGDGLMKVSAASFSLWQLDRSSPKAYRLKRQTAWYAVDELPESAVGRTRIAPPPTQVRNLLFDLLNNGAAEELLKAAETRLPEYIFWLDLSCLVAVALTRLGSRFEKARAAVCQETAFLQYRLPGLEQLSFSDGTPFASPDTRQWLKTIAFRKDRASPLPLVAAPSAPEAETEALIESQRAGLQQLLCAGQLVQALEVIQQKLRSSTSRREQLLWRLSLAGMLAEVGKSSYALPYLEQVLEDIDRYGLEQYDPSLALRALKLAWLAFENQAEQKFKDQAQQVLHRIGRVNLPEMVRLIED